MINCSLCKSQSIECLLDIDEKADSKIQKRRYFDCQDCGFIFLDPKLRLPSMEEKKRYLQHKNCDEDERYHLFLDQLWSPLKNILLKKIDVKEIVHPIRGLDYGCGPEPVLVKKILREGFDIEGYDPYFNEKLSLLKFNKENTHKYSFITCTEVVEHFYHPLDEFERWKHLIAPGGLLGVMSHWFDKNKSDFKSWYYRKDPTHVSFYREKTLMYLSNLFQWEILYLSERVCIFRS